MYQKLQQGRAFLYLNNQLKVVKNPNIPNWGDFVGVERQKELLLKNTKAFVEGKSVNDVLLWGKRGTGKSSLIRSLLGIFPTSLKLLQVDKDEIEFLFEFYEIAKILEGKFIVLIDDLTITGEDARTIRLLKTLLDGSVIERPQNVTIYATSNRKNLAPTTFLEKEYKFPQEEMEERFSLVDRFGLKIGFTDFGKKDYLEAVKIYCRKFGINYNGEVEKKAMEFAANKEFSGRTALQFVKYLQILD
jgi:predicted AAA+ superfamily ATPase